MVLLRYRTLIFCHPRFRSEIKVDGQLNVTTELILGHSHVANSKVQAQHFLHLVLDGASNFINVSEAMKASYLFAIFLSSAFSFFSALSWSCVRNGSPSSPAFCIISTCLALAITHIFMLAFGGSGSL